MSHTNGGIPWDDLSDSATRTVAWWIHQLADGTCSRFDFQCHQGGIRSVTVEQVIERYEDGSRRVRVETYQPDELVDV